MKMAVVTGSSRGIGAEVARQLSARGCRVVVTSRDGVKAEEMARRVGGEALSHVLDTASSSSIHAFVEWLRTKTDRLDVLVNNAAVYLDAHHGVLQVPESVFDETIATNVRGPFLLTQLCADLLRRSGEARVVNLSSGLGQLSHMVNYAPSYSLSKAAINALTRMFAHAFEHDGVLVNSVDPGWVKTDMGGASAPRSVQEGADTVVWLATLPKNGPTGKLFRDRKEIEW